MIPGSSTAAPENFKDGVPLFLDRAPCLSCSSMLSTGIRNNSFAATWQSNWRNPANKNDLFAKLQSGGTSGFPGHYNVYFGLVGFILVVSVAEPGAWV
ncbi:hypothetical protein MTO96_023633 [Rhipicephalus appendiculatus]